MRKRTGHRIGPPMMPRLPNLDKTTAYLHKKAHIHIANRERFLKEADEAYKILEPLLEETLAKFTERKEEGEKPQERIKFSC